METLILRMGAFNVGFSLVGLVPVFLLFVLYVAMEFMSLLISNVMMGI